ncbi:MAG: tetratricopeptide repeat protein, partial [Nitrospinae bacterium]|nr:tetratricopeptide repeat protein [Nitrospinota bacterium]
SIDNMGNAFYRTGKLEESAAAYKKALELDPSDMDAKFNLEFVREQIEKKKQEQQKQKQDKKDQQAGDEQDKNGDPQKDQADSKEPPSPDEQQNQDESAQQPSRLTDAGMTTEEAEQRLDALTEDLRKFQRKQARDMESLFTYQGNDW